MRFGQRKSQRLDRWHVQAAAYSIALVEWFGMCQELPASIKVKDDIPRSALLAAEVTRLNLVRTWERLSREAARLGVEIQLPEPVWPEVRQDWATSV